MNCRVYIGIAHGQMANGIVINVCQALRND